MSNIILDFQQAKVKHLQFKSNLRSILYGASDIDENPVLSHYDCTVGKWIYEYALGQYGHLPEMIALENVHADIHSKASELISLYKKGAVLEARSGLSDMEQIADRLVNLLTLLEAQIVNNTAKFKDSPDYQTPERTISELQILARTNEELDKIINRQSMELLHERKMLKDLFMQFPAMIAIFKGANHIIEMANNPFFKFAGKQEIIGKNVFQVLPELKDQGIIDMLDKVFSTGEAFSVKALPVRINNINMLVEEFYLDISFVPLRSANDSIEGIISFSYEVSEFIRSRKILEEKVVQLQQVNDILKVEMTFRNKL